MAYAVKGGIGDFLQCLPFMLSHPTEDYFVVTHQRKATEFFKELGLKVQEFSFGQLPDAELCPRQFFFDKNPFSTLRQITSKQPVVGVHLGASDYSLSIESRFGFPPKALPKSILEGLAQLDYNLLVFGSPKELDIIENGPWALVKEDSLNESLSWVSECDAFIGSDSAFKTMSAMLRIPTFVLAGDYKDEHRDQRFIDPYVKAGVMSVFHYRDLTHCNEYKAAIRFCRQQLEKRCLVLQI